jgi:hypothetical protein
VVRPIVILQLLQTFFLSSLLPSYFSSPHSFTLMLHIADAHKGGPSFEYGRLKLHYSEMMWSCAIVNVEMKLAPHGIISCVIHVQRAYVESVAIVYGVHCHV